MCTMTVFLRTCKGDVVLACRNESDDVGVTAPVANFGEAQGRRELLHALRELHARAGRPSSRDLARRIGDISHTTVAECLSGRRLPSWNLLARIVQGLDGDEEEFRTLWNASVVTDTRNEANAYVEAYKQLATQYFRRLRTPYGQVAVDEAWVTPSLLAPSQSETQVRSYEAIRDEILEGGAHVLILGSAGSGKTTLCQSLAYAAATSSSAPMPVLIPFHSLDTNSVSRRSLVREIEHHLEDVFQSAPPEGLVLRLAEEGTLLVLLDGLDELSSQTRREEWLSLIELFDAKFSRVSVVVTSRQAPREWVKGGWTPFNRYVLAPFRPEQIAEYVARRANAEGEARPLDQPLLEELKYAGHAARNPLLLTMLVEVWLRRHYLPRTPARLYEELAGLMLGGWDERKDLDRGLDPGVTSGGLGRLAWSMTENDQHWMTWEDARATLIDHYVHTSGLSANAADTAERVLRQCVDRGAVLQEIGVDALGAPRLSFAYEMFREYFAASYLIATASTVEQLAEVLVKIADDERWTTIAPLAVGLFTSRAGGRDAALVDELQRLIPADPDREAVNAILERVVDLD